MEDYELVNQMQRGQKADEVLNNPIYEESWTVVEQQFFQAIKDSPQRDVEGRESLALAIKLLAKVRMHVESVVTTGKQATLALRDRKTWRERLNSLTEWTG